MTDYRCCIQSFEANDALDTRVNVEIVGLKAQIIIRLDLLPCPESLSPGPRLS